MATNRSIRGISGRGFRIPNSSAAKKTIKEGVVALVDVDDRATQLILAREKDNFVRVLQNSGTFTVTIATPGVVSKATHGFAIGDAVVFSTTGALPTGLLPGVRYWVITAGFGAGAFQVSATRGGAAINTSGSQSGVHTVDAASTSIVGLTRFGFRVYQTDGNIRSVKLGSGVHSVDLTDGRVLRVLKRNAGQYVVSASATAVDLRGLHSAQAGFQATASAANQDAATITQAGGNASNAATVTINARVYTIKTSLTEVKATNTVNDTAGTPANNATAVVNGRTYTFKTALTPANDEILINGGAGSMTNFQNAINGSGGVPGTDYQVATANADVTAVAATTTTTLTARTPGTAANAFTLAVTGVNLARGAATFSGGVNPVLDELKIAGSAALTFAALVKLINLTGTAGTDYSTGQTINADVTAVLTSATVATLKGVAGGTAEITVATNEATYTVAGAQLSDPQAKVKRLVTNTVNPQDETIYTQLRRRNKSYIEV